MNNNNKFLFTFTGINVHIGSPGVPIVPADNTASTVM